MAARLRSGARRASVSTIGAALVGCCEPQKKMSRKQQLQLLQHEQQASFGSLAELS